MKSSQKLEHIRKGYRGMIDVTFPGTKNLSKDEKRGWKYIVHKSYDKHTLKIFNRKKEILSFRDDLLAGQYKGRVVHNTKRYRLVKPEAIKKRGRR